MKRGMRIGFGAVLGMVVLGLVALMAFSQQDEKPSIAPNVYKEFMAATVADIYELEAYFADQQSSYLPIMPPDPDLVLHQFGCPPVLPFDWKGFPSEYNENLVFEYENSVPVYSISIEEDPITRATVFLNADGKTLFTLCPRPRITTPSPTSKPASPPFTADGTPANGSPPGNAFTIRLASGLRSN